LLAKLMTLAGAGSDVARLANDDSINLHFRTVVYLYVADALELPVPDRATFEMRAREGFLGLDRTSLERNTRALELSYPDTYSISKDYLDSLKKALANYRPVSTGSGCLMPILVTLGIVLALILL